MRFLIANERGRSIKQMFSQQTCFSLIPSAQTLSSRRGHRTGTYPATDQDDSGQVLKEGEANVHKE